MCFIKNMRIQVSYFTYYLVTYWLLFLIVFFCVLVVGIIIPKNKR